MKDWRPQTWAVRAQAEESTHHEHSVPMFLTSSFVFEDSEEMRAAFAGEIDRSHRSRHAREGVGVGLVLVTVSAGLAADVTGPGRDGIGVGAISRGQAVPVLTVLETITVVVHARASGIDGIVC